MKYRPLGKSGILASAIGFGAWGIGGYQWGGTDEEAALSAVRTALDHGITLIDTAPIYGFGLSEDIIGRAIEGRRDEVVLATKCGLVWDAPENEYVHPSWDTPGRHALSRKSVLWEVERSLVRLRTDHIDLYQTHWPDPETPIAETMEALMDLKQQGKIRAIGACNVTTEQMDEYRSVGQLDVDQESYSILNRKMESSQIPYCRKHEIAILGYSPLVMGLLSGKVSPDREFPEGDLRRKSPTFSRPNIIKVNAMLDELRPIAERHGINIAQLVIAWTAEQPGITHVLSGIRTTAQAIDNSRAGEVNFTREDMAAIDAVIEKHGYGHLGSTE